MPLLGQLARGAGAAMLRGKFSRRQGRRGALTAKRGNKDFYKGKGGLKPGVHTPKGGYRFRDTKMIDYRVPDLTGFNVSDPRHVGGRSRMRQSRRLGDPRPPARLGLRGTIAPPLPRR